MTEHHDMSSGTPGDPREAGAPGRTAEAHARVHAARERRARRAHERRKQAATRSARVTAVVALFVVLVLAGVVAWWTPEVRAYVTEMLPAANTTSDGPDESEGHHA